jgi:hypothetical protein
MSNGGFGGVHVRLLNALQQIQERKHLENGSF